MHQNVELFTTSITMMHIYYPTLDAISQQTQQLDGVACRHCGKTEQLVSHGFVYKKQALATAPVPVGKRVLCSQRFGRTGCGRTVQLYLASMVRYLHGGGQALACFIASLLVGMTMANAYQQATSRDEPRHAYRWLQKLFLHLSEYRRQSHTVQFTDVNSPQHPRDSSRQRLIVATLERLLLRYPAPLCATYQLSLQRSFL